MWRRSFKMASTIKKFYFEVPKELRQSDSKIRIYGIAIEGDDFVIEFVDTRDKIQRIKSYITGDKHNDIESVRKLVECRLSYFFDEAATVYCTGRLVDVIDRLYDTDAAHAIEKVKKHHRAESAKYNEQAGRLTTEKEKPVYTVKKFSGVTTVSPNGVGLAEAVIIGGQPMFAYTINGGTSVTFYEELETEDMILRPPRKQEYPPDSAYEFPSQDEFMEYIRIANEEDNLYRLYRDVRKFYTKDYFVDTEPKNSTLLALYTITSYFQDKFSTVPYIWLIGDNGSGKNSILMTYSWLGYRVFYMSGASGANICEYLGTVEEGQGTVAEDELGNLDEDEYKKLLYMTGYASGSCVPKILNGNTDGREQRYYRSYCQKISASESLPSIKYSKGVLDREFIIKCVKGFPKYNIKTTKKRTRTPEVLRLINDLQTLKKRLFAFRLAHFDDTIGEIQGLSISGRALELTESALLLFNRFKSSSSEDSKIFNDEIIPTLSAFLNDRSSRRNDSLEARLYPIIKAMTDAQNSDEFDNDTIFNVVQSEMGGRDIPGKSDIFYVDDLGITVTRTKIMKVLREKFKAVPVRTILLDGSTKRALKISSEVLERIKASYEDPWEIKIISIEDTSDQVNQPNQVIDQVGKGEKGPLDQVEDATTTPNLEENTSNNVKIAINDIGNKQEDISESHENSPPISTKPGLPGLVGQSYSIEEIINKCMQDEHGNNKGYLMENELKTRLMMLPVQDRLYCNEERAQQTWEALVQQGKLVEIEPGRYKPVTTTTTDGSNHPTVVFNVALVGNCGTEEEE
jgi:hypothetical protein